MTTRLEAINIMLSCIGHAPINTLVGTQSSFTIMAQTLLDSELKRVQLRGFDFNTEEDYVLEPDTDGYVNLASNITKVEVNQEYLNRYVQRGNKMYDKVKHTYIINEPLIASVTFSLTFDEVPEVVKRYVTMSAAYKFVKRELGSQAVCVFTQEDLMEARADMYNHEIDIGNYSMIPAYYTREIRGDL